MTARRKFKKIANDATHTVSTIGKMPDDLDICYGMINIGNDLRSPDMARAPTAV